MTGIFAGAEWYIIFPLGGSLLLFATCGWILLWPRVGSWLAAIFLVCIATWPAMVIVDDASKHQFADALFWVGFLTVITVALWFTSKEALGFARHTSSCSNVVYWCVAMLLIITLPSLVFLNFYSSSRVAEVREFPAGFRGSAFVVWGERNYPPLPKVRGKFIEHFGPDGILITSTPQHSGWARDQLYFYDTAGNRVKEAHGDILTASGQVGTDDKAIHYDELFVGTEEERSKQSEELYAQKQKRLDELFKKLHPDWVD
jgi:hypothetical protein